MALRAITTGLAAAALAFGSFVAIAPAAQAGDITCRGEIRNRWISGDVKVPAGATCRIFRSTVKGNVEVRRGANLVTYKLRADGNVQGERHKLINLRYGTIDGDVQAEDGRAMYVQDVRVNGNVQSENNYGTHRVWNSRIDGDVQLFKNRTAWTTVKSNVIDGNLQCKNNTGPMNGSKNRVAGDKEGQCRRF